MSLVNNATGPHHGQPILTEGQPLAQATAAMILIHGRGRRCPRYPYLS